MPTAEPELPVTILVDPDRFGPVTSELAAAGVRVDEQLPAVGVVTGRVTADRVATVGRIDGVLSVEADRGTQLPPPDSDVQ
jgi:hypothetical protein